MNCHSSALRVILLGDRLRLTLKRALPGRREGEEIELYSSEGDWWNGRLRRTGAIGIFPSNYVERISPTS
jgi:hypothetical protein